jgi:release factor glutamine methyltransferase
MHSDRYWEEEAATRGASTYGEALRHAVRWLREVGALDSPELDAEILLSHVTGVSRASLLAFPERLITPEQAESYARLVRLRSAHQPVAYLTGHREFMGLDLLVDPRVLIPRPETELLVEEALNQITKRFGAGAIPIVADIGTGSGAIALSVAIHEPRLPYLYATDISADALAVAEENARRLDVADRVIFLQSDLLERLPASIDILLANLPYVAPKDAPLLPADVGQYEPGVALFGDDDGLGHLRRLFQQAPAHLAHGATLLLEFGYDQREAVEALALEAFPDCRLQAKRDYAGWDRYLVIQTS